MKKILFPVTSKIHLARQQLLLKELKIFFDVKVVEYHVEYGKMHDQIVGYAHYFDSVMGDIRPDMVLIRADRYELLPVAMLAAYRGIPIVHLEAGDESGVIDNKVRHAITKLSDYGFCTNTDAFVRLVNMGVDPRKIWNFGSLDVEYAMQVKDKNPRKKSYILVAYHPIENENEKELDEALKGFDKYDIIRIGSNHDYGRNYGNEYYDSEDYINFVHHAVCCVGNSSSFLKEVSIFGTPVVLVGERQKNRLMPKNVLSVACESKKIKTAIEFQIQNKYESDFLYYKPGTSKRITEQLKKIFYEV